MKLPRTFDRVPVDEVLVHLETLMDCEFLADNWTKLLDRTRELLKSQQAEIERLENIIEQRTPKVQIRPNVHVACGMMESRTSKYD